LRRLAYSIAEKALTETDVKAIPVILKSTTIDRSDEGDNLLKLITQTTLEYTDSNTPCLSDDDLNKGNLLILIDSLDEVDSPKRSAIVSKILDFHKRYPQCRIVVTSRNYSSIINLPELRDFVRFNISPINLKQAQKLVERLSRGKSLPVDKANEMLRQLNEIHGLELNPLLVTVFVATSDYSRRDIPANITELFKKFTEMMLGRWDQKKGLSQQYQAPLKDFLLKQLSFSMHHEKITKIPLIDCKNIFECSLKETGHHADLEVLFDEIIYRSGLFRVEDDGIVFRHMLLQEFFAGRGVPSPAFFQSVIAEDRWKHPLIFYFGENPDAHPVLDSLIENISDYGDSELYRAAVAIGLAIQACYLSKVSDKFQSMQWVMQSLAKAEQGFLREAEEYNPNLPLSAFLGYYLFGKDSVACEAIKGDILKRAKEILQSRSNDASDVLVFWHIVSLIEAGSLDKAQILIKEFKPADIRLLLSLNVGCFLIENLRVTSTEDKKIAKKIREFIDPKINHLKQQVLNEMKSMLLEVRKGKIEALPSPANEKS